MNGDRVRFRHEITVITEKDSQESYVYANPINATVQKIYWRLTQLQLLRYATLQNEFGTLSFSFPEHENILYQEKEVKKLVIEVLDIPYISNPVSFIGEGSKRRRRGNITEPRMVNGESLSDEMNRNIKVGGKKFQDFLNMISWIQTAFKAWSNHIGIVDAKCILENAKVESFVNGELKIIITDITNDVGHLISMNDSWAYRYMTYSYRYIKENLGL